MRVRCAYNCIMRSYTTVHGAVTAARTSEVARKLPKAKVALRRMALLRRGSPWLRLAVRAGPLAAAAALSSCGLTDCRAANAANPHGLNDAEWYAAQHAHISLGLPLVEEARQGWWHEVTRRLRSNGEDVNACDPRDGTTLLHLACREGRRRLVEELLSLGAALEALRVGEIMLSTRVKVKHDSGAAETTFGALLRNVAARSSTMVLDADLNLYSHDERA